MDLTQISLFPATPEQIIAHRKRTFEQWGRGLALEEYLKRPHSAGVEFIVWSVLLALCLWDIHRSFKFKDSIATRGSLLSRFLLFLRNVSDSGSIGADTFNGMKGMKEKPLFLRISQKGSQLWHMVSPQFTLLLKTEEKDTPRT